MNGTDDTHATEQDEVQPDEYPLTFDEWAHERRSTRPVERVLVAGFAHVTRSAGKLRSYRHRAEWDADFDAFTGTRA